MKGLTGIMVETKTTPQKNIFFIITCLDTFLVVNNFLSKILFFFEQLASYFIICQLLFFEHLLGNTCLIVNFFSWGPAGVTWNLKELLLSTRNSSTDFCSCGAGQIFPWKSESVKAKVWKWKWMCGSENFKIVRPDLSMEKWKCETECVEVKVWK